jgi:hypothetical protein
MTRARSIGTQEFNQLSNIGGRGGHQSESGPQWCFSGQKNAAFTVTPANHEFDLTSDGIAALMKYMMAIHVVIAIHVVMFLIIFSIIPTRNLMTSMM